ncbi:MAG: hypothetical protein ACE5D1_04845 [Fidelibacterota bacterium]
MKTLRNKSLPFIYFFIAVLSSVNAQSEAGAIFLLISPSPTQNGVGELSVCLPSNDVFAGFYNPANGLLGYQGLSAGASTERIQWLKPLADDLWYNYSVTGLGLIPGKYPFQLVISQHKTYLDLGEQVRTDDMGQVMSTFNAYMKAKALTAGIRTVVKLGRQPLHFSLGMTRKYAVQVLSDLENDSTAGPSENVLFDYGFMLSLPISHPRMKVFREALDMSLTPSVGYSISNVGGYVTFIDPDQADPAPRLARTGLALSAVISLDSDWKIVEWRGGRAVSDILIDTSDPQRRPYPYQSGLGDIDFVKHVLESKADKSVTISRGAEISVFECFSYRQGRWIDTSGRIDVNQTGYGVQLDGMLKFLYHFTGQSGARKLAQFMDIQYNYSRWRQYSGHPLDQTEFKSVVLILKNLDRFFIPK